MFNFFLILAYGELLNEWIRLSVLKSTSQISTHKRGDNQTSCIHDVMQEEVHRPSVK